MIQKKHLIIKFEQSPKDALSEHDPTLMSSLQLNSKWEINELAKKLVELPGTR